MSKCAAKLVSVAKAVRGLHGNVQQREGVPLSEDSYDKLVITQSVRQEKVTWNVFLS